MATCEKCGLDLDCHGRRGDSLIAELFYPPRDDHSENPQDRARYIKVDLCDVRAADGLRISYDFDRDGWKVEQLRWEAGYVTRFGRDGGPDEHYEWPEEWVEVSFHPSWGSRLCDDEHNHSAKHGHFHPQDCPECTEEVP